MTDDGWIRLAARRNNIGPLHACVVSLGAKYVAPTTLIKMKAHKYIRHIEIGDQKYTRREWVAEWLKSLEKPLERDSAESHEPQHV